MSKRGIWILLIYLVPPVFFYIGLSQSHSLGLAVVVLCFLVFITLYERIDVARQFIEGRLVLAVLAVALHMTLSAMGEPKELSRSVPSLLFVWVCMAASSILAVQILNASSASFGRTIKQLFWMLVFIGVWGAIRWGQPTLGDEWAKPIFPFTEHSHFALVFTPILLYMCVNSPKKYQALLLLLSLFLAMVLQNLTLVVGVSLVAVVSFGVLITSVLALALVGFLFSQFDLSYFLSRLDFSDATENLSALTYLRGWQALLESLSTTWGWGVGFQQMGFQTVDLPAADLIDSLYPELGSDFRDGSFLLSKLVSEFGFFGVMIALYFLVVALRSLRSLRSVIKHKTRMPSQVIFANCVLTAFTIDMLVRGIGYFTGTTFVALVAYIIVARTRANNVLLRETNEKHR